MSNHTEIIMQCIWIWQTTSIQHLEWFTWECLISSKMYNGKIENI